MRKQCNNPDIYADHSEYRGWGKPDMVRIYIRISERITHTKAGSPIAYYEQKTKRSWNPVGMICPGCRWIVLDEIPSKVEEAG